MAKVKIQGNASGTGILTVTAPNTSTDRTITLPDATGTLATTADSVGGANGVDFNDGVKAKFGTGDDLEIYHDGSHSYVKDNGTGMLIIDTNGDRVRMQAAGSEELANFNRNGSVELFYDNASKLATTATGVAVTGGVAIGGTGTANTLDDYEEGTFTMAVQDWSSAGFSIGTVDKAVYTKIGNAVTIWFKAQLVCDSSSPGGGDLKFTGFPFGTTGGYQVYVDVIFDHLTTHQTNMRLSFYGSGGYLYCLDSSGDLVDMTASLGGTNNMSLSFTYMTN
jgi:hypothetical protein